MTQAPTPGPLSGDDVKLLVKGDLLLLDGQPVRFINLFMGGIRADDGSDKRISALPVERFAFIDRPDADGWMPWSGGENPVPGQMVEVKWRNGRVFIGPSDDVALFDWRHMVLASGSDIIAFRLAPTAPVEASGSEREFETAEAMAEAWSDRVEIQRMVETTSAVFAKWASPELLSRFRQQMMAVIQQAYIEGVGSRVEALRPQPSGETRDVEPVLERLRGVHRRNPTEYVEVCAIIDDVRALIRPAPVASGGQHSSGEAEPLRVLLDNLVIAQTLSKDLRQKATDEARSYLYELRHAAPVAETAGEAVARSMADTFRAKIAAIPLASEIIHGDGPITQRLSAEHFDALILEARSPVAETVGKGHRPECWGATSYSDEMAHCYCSSSVPAQDDDKLREAIALAEYVCGLLPSLSGAADQPDNKVYAAYANKREIMGARDRLAALKSTAAKEGGSK